MKRIFILVLFVLPLFGLAQEKQPDYGIKFSGFVKSDYFYDSREVTSIREGHFLLYPTPVSKDVNGSDLNEKGNFNFLSIQTRLKGAITGPDAFGAKTSGVIEADFFGNENTNFQDVNGFRLRHAFVKLNWANTEILAGQFWHPMFIPENFPGTISFNTGAPFQPFSRNPQLRLTQKFAPSVKLIATLFSQRDFQSTGPNGGSVEYIRNSGIPNANVQLQFNLDSGKHQINIGADYKTLMPELSTSGTSGKYKTTNTLSSFSLFAGFKFKLAPVTLKLYAILAQNATDLTMLGGYAVSKVNDAVTGAKTFTNLNTQAFWLDAQTNGKTLQYGVFVGYTKNKGSNDDVTTIYARGSNIDNVYRISPRVVFISGKLSIAIEAEYTVAAYGTANGDKKGGVTDVSGDTTTKNFRPLLAFTYNF